MYKFSKSNTFLKGDDVWWKEEEKNKNKIETEKLIIATVIIELIIAIINLITLLIK